MLAPRLLHWDDKRVDRVLDEVSFASSSSGSSGSASGSASGSLCGACGAIMRVPCDDAVPVCSACGLVQVVCLDSVPEWKTFRCEEIINGGGSGGGGGGGGARGCSGGNANGINVRCTAPQHPLFDSSMPYCKMQWTAGDHKAATARKRWKSIANPLRPRAGNSDRLFYEHCMHMSQVALLHDIKRAVADRMCWWYREMSLVHKFHGAMSDAMKAACLDYACREYGAPRTVLDCAAVFGATRKDTTRCINLLEVHRNNILNDDGQHCTDEQTKRQRQLRIASVAVPQRMLRVALPAEYIPQFCVHFPQFDDGKTLLCLFVARKIERLRLVQDNYPPCTAASVIYFVSEEYAMGVRKNALYRVTNISEVTINRCYNKIIPFRRQLLPTEDALFP